MSILPNNQALAQNVEFTDDALIVHLQDGRSISVSLEEFPKLRNASRDQRNNWRLVGLGYGIHWKDLDEDLAVSGLLAPAMISRPARKETD